MAEVILALSISANRKTPNKQKGRCMYVSAVIKGNGGGGDDVETVLDMLESTCV